MIKKGNWSQLLKGSDVLNRGISGERIECTKQRLKYLKNLKAKYWIIEGGINDLHTDYASPDSVLKSYVEIIAFVRAENAIPIVNIITYINEMSNSKFVDINKELKKRMSYCLNIQRKMD